MLWLFLSAAFAAPEICDGIDNDSDGGVDEGPHLAFDDIDGDGFGDPAAWVVVPGPCFGDLPPPTDCDDGVGTVRPGATELCNGVDDDCDGVVDEGAACSCVESFLGDSTYQTCVGVETHAAAQQACQAMGYGLAIVNDATEEAHLFSQSGGNANIDYWIDLVSPNDGDNSWYTLSGAAAPYEHWAANEPDDSGSPNCGQMQTDDTAGFNDKSCLNVESKHCEVHCTPRAWYSDSDGDGQGVPLASAAGCQAPLNHVAVNGDCDDTDSAVHSTATEVCNGVDDDCDGFIDEGVESTWYEDADGDGFGGVNAVISCTPPAGYSATNGDCDDGVITVFPGATETCNDVDDDCDNATDEGLPTFPWFMDADGDGYGLEGSPPTQDCGQPTGFVDDATDCDDALDTIHPGATEICDDVDQDCDGAVDDGVLLSWWADDDTDGFGDVAALVLACTQPIGAVANANDCDDNRAEAYPMAPELCNELDDDCDGTVDEHVVLVAWYPDADADLYGDANASSVFACTAPAGHVSDNTDCNDAANSVFPGAEEVCNGLDDDCDGLDDNGTTMDATWWLDIDGDTFGDPTMSQVSCTQPSGYVLSDGDCDDDDPDVNPAAIEICNGQDDNCDTLFDDGDPNVVATDLFYADQDQDGYGDGLGVPACAAPPTLVAQDGDCNDDVAAINPGVAEVCDNIDNDCDGFVDDDDPNVVGIAFYFDLDMDGTGGALQGHFCIQPGDGAAFPGDCDDTDATIWPGAPELCDGVDHDCDGLSVELYTDADGDSYGGELSDVCDPQIDVVDHTDCDDTDPLTFPGADEVPGDGIDQDCDGMDSDPIDTGLPIDTADTDVGVDTDDTDVVLPPDDTDGGGGSVSTTGCGCDGGVGSAGWLGLIPLLWARRRAAA